MARRTNDDRDITMAVRWTLVRDAQGHPKSILAINTDITRQKMAVEALAELSRRTERRERILTSTLSFISDFAYIYARDGRFLFVNQPLLDL
jgi:PAS domain-containing protein